MYFMYSQSRGVVFLRIVKSMYFKVVFFSFDKKQEKTRFAWDLNSGFPHHNH